MDVLLTGGTGYIGSHAAIALVEAGHEVALLDDFSNSKPAVLDRLRTIIGKDLPFHEVDVTNESDVYDVLRGGSFDAAVHFAAPKSVSESVQNPLHYYKNGIGGTVALCRAMDRCGVRNIVFSSSATVYGISDQLPLTEDMPTQVINPYGRTKLVCEEMLADLHRSNPQWNAVALRYFNPVGAHPSGLIGEDPRGVPANLVPYIAQVAVRRRPVLKIYGGDYPTPDGTGVRDYIHVLDLAEGHVAAVECLAASPGFDVINLGTGRGASVREMVAVFEEATGGSIPTKVVERRPGDSAASWADPSKAERALGWVARRTLHDMASDAWRWQSRYPTGLPSSS
jgi:UDP-glucose 4-epimerase